MDKLRQKDLMNEQVRWVNIEGVKYFSVDDIREKFKELKVGIENLIDSPMGKLVPFKDIEKMTEFDDTIMKTLMFNPKK